MVVECERDGSIGVSTHAVMAQADGIHVIVRNRTGESASILGFGVYAQEPDEEHVAQTPPGAVRVGCRKDSAPLGSRPPTKALRVIDPHDYWTDPGELRCPGGVVSVTSGGGQGQAGDPLEIAREGLEGPKDIVQLAGYPEARERRFRVLRNGRVVRIGDLFSAPNGGWIRTNLVSCASVR